MPNPEPAPIFVYTRHADNNLTDRGIRRAEVERTILEPDARSSDPHHPERIRAYRRLEERDGRCLRVVYVEEVPLTYRIITFFLDRGWRRSRESQIRPGR